MLRFVDLTAAIYPQDPDDPEDPAPRTCGIFNTVTDRFLDAWGCHSLGDMEDVFEAGRAMCGSVAGGQRAQGLVPAGFFYPPTTAGCNPPPISTHPCIYMGPPVFGPQTEGMAKIEAAMREGLCEFVLTEVRATLVLPVPQVGPSDAATAVVG